MAILYIMNCYFEFKRSRKNVLIDLEFQGVIYIQKTMNFQQKNFKCLSSNKINMWGYE